MKVVTVVGARPQFIKAAVVSREIMKRESINEVIIHTGQHFDKNMSDIFFDQMNIPRPNYNLSINNLGHGAMTGLMLQKIEEVLLNEEPDWVLVYGDTNSTIAGALAAKKLHIKVAHVEAGLRSFNMRMPEEINRILTDRISDILFCPTKTATKNLISEGFESIDCKIVNSGDVMYDAALYYKEKIVNPVPEGPDNFVLATIHRAENTNDKERMLQIFESLNIISEETSIILPLHPRTKNLLNSLNFIPSKELYIIDPVGYFEMLFLLEKCNLVLTDSGGLQKEAYFFNKPCITYRDETEWLELVENNVNYLTGANKKNIIDTYHFINNNVINFEIGLYGDGKAGEKIVNELLRS